jgi:hypothetical protein
LRPQQWLDSHHAIVGSQVSVDIPEIGVRSAARVLSIEPSPAIKSGSGQVITGTFRHVARNLVDVYVEGENDPIRCTERHPFWSLTRQTWVAASQLQTGERLLNRLGQSTQVVSVNFATEAEPVFNIEVQGRHVYRVTKLGLLVHNASWQLNPRRSSLASALTSSENAGILARNLAREGRAPGVGEAAGHIVASTGTLRQWSSAAKSRQLLEKIQIGINDAANGIAVGHPRPHNFMHTRAFNDMVELRLQAVVDQMSGNYGYRAIRSALRKELRAIGRSI